MKKIGTYTCRGTVTPGVEHRISLDDGTFKTGYRIISFVVAPYDIDNTNIRTFAGKVATVGGLDEAIWNWADQREVAWSWFGHDANASQGGQHFSQVDNDTMIVQDCYVYADEPAGSTTGFMNYHIEFEKYEFSDWQGALAMARDKSSGGD